MTLHAQRPNQALSASDYCHLMHRPRGAPPANRVRARARNGRYWPKPEWPLWVIGWLERPFAATGRGNSPTARLVSLDFSNLPPIGLLSEVLAA